MYCSYVIYDFVISFIWVGLTCAHMVRKHVTHICQYTHPHIIYMMTMTLANIHKITMVPMDLHDPNALSLCVTHLRRYAHTTCHLGGGPHISQLGTCILHLPN